jgi:hypothetical protein
MKEVKEEKQEKYKTDERKSNEHPEIEGRKRK